MSEVLDVFWWCVLVGLFLLLAGFVLGLAGALLSTGLTFAYDLAKRFGIGP